MSIVCYLDKDIKCPFYRRLDFKQRQIVCEGVDGASSSRLQFMDKANMKNYVLRRCTTDYCLCCQYRGLYEFYEVENEQGIN